MLQNFYSKHHTDEAGNPTGGVSVATGVTVAWQDGPLGRGDDRREPNGAFVETLLAITAERIAFYQQAAGGKFACAENAKALVHIGLALDTLNTRTKRRDAAGIEGHPRRGAHLMPAQPAISEVSAAYCKHLRPMNPAEADCLRRTLNGREDWSNREEWIKEPRVQRRKEKP